jgi:hypothetical protein
VTTVRPGALPTVATWNVPDGIDPSAATGAGVNTNVGSSVYASPAAVAPPHASRSSSCVFDVTLSTDRMPLRIIPASALVSHAVPAPVTVFDPFVNVIVPVL